MFHTLRLAVRGLAVPNIAQSVADILLTWQGREEQRRQLADLDERLLRDIGLSWADAQREAAKPFWRP